MSMMVNTQWKTNQWWSIRRQGNKGGAELLTYLRSHTYTVGCLGDFRQWCIQYMCIRGKFPWSRCHSFQYLTSRRRWNEEGTWGMSILFLLRIQESAGFSGTQWTLTWRGNLFLINNMMLMKRTTMGIKICELCLLPCYRRLFFFVFWSLSQKKAGGRAARCVWLLLAGWLRYYNSCGCCLWRWLIYRTWPTLSTLLCNSWY